MYLFNVAGVVLPALLTVGFFDNLATLIQKTSDSQKAQDASSSKLNPAYVLNKTEEYDYIIIGGGATGGVVMNRLSRNKNLRILVIQDGGDPNPYVDIPGLAREIRFQPSVDYAYKIAKQKNACLGQNSYERDCVVNRGIGLGGSSNLFSMSVLRGNRRDFDRWAEQTDDNTWASDNVFRIIKKMEDYHGHYQPIDRRYHGQGGESYVSAKQPEDVQPLAYDACVEMGLPVDVDMNANLSKGCGYLDLNIKRGIRWGSYHAFIQQALKRPNLTIYRYAKATKIHFDNTMRATSVTYVRHGVVRNVKVKYEIILSAGPIDSPKLLMLSGIGISEHLNSVGVKPLLELPVGMNYQDHVGVNIEFFVNKSKIGFIPKRDLSSEVVAQYLTQGNGPMASPFFNPRTLIFTASQEFNDPMWPDLEILPQATYVNTSNNGVFEDKLLLQVLLTRPLSSGYVQLRSSNPSDPPIIDPQFFTQESDFRRLVEGIQFGVKILEKSNAFKRIGIKLGLAPECRQYSNRKKYFECIVQHYTFTLCHPAGTVKMGKSGDPTAVLNSKLRVVGTKNLRVVDTSITPHIPSGHLYTPALMIGELGSKFILETRKN